MSFWRGPTALHRKVGGAIRNLDSAHMALFKKCFLECALGRSVIASASLLLQTSAKEEAANRKVSRAIEALDDSRLPKLEALTIDNEATRAVVRNFRLISEGSIAEVLDESLADIYEACKMWCVPTMRQKAGDIMTWINALLKNLLFYDECTSLYLQAVAYQGGFEQCVCISNGAIALSSPSSAGSACGEPKASFRTLSSFIEDRMFDEDALQKFAVAFQSFLEFGIPESIRGDMPTSNALNELRTKVLVNFEARNNFLTALEAIAELGVIPPSPEEALAEWREKQLLGKDSSSFLVQAVVAQNAVRTLRDTPLYMADGDGDEVVLTLDEGQGLQALTGSYKASAGMHARLLVAPVVQATNRLLEGVMQVATDEFSDSLKLSVARVAPPVLAAPNTNAVALMLQGFYEPGAGPDMVKCVSRVFATSGRKDHAWPSRSLLTLLSKLTGTIPQGMCQISLRKFCRPNAPVLQVEIEKALPLWEMMSMMSETFHIFAFCRSRILEDEPLGRDGCLKDDFAMAVSVVHVTINKAVSLSVRSDMILGIAPAVVWSEPTIGCGEWFAAAQAAAEQLSVYLVGKMVAALASLSRNLLEVTPPFNHIAGDQFFNARLARQQLLGWPRRGELNERSVALFRAMSAVSRLHTQWGLSPALGQDERFAEDLASAQRTFQSARTAICVIAAVNVVVELRDQEQVAGATDLLRRKVEGMPLALQAQLEKIVGA